MGVKQTEALKLALEALEFNCISSEDGEDLTPSKTKKAITAIREVLAEQETVLPGGGHVPTIPVAVYGYCPECGGAGVMRERQPNGDDKCTNGHKYPSSKALAEQPAPPPECQTDAEKTAFAFGWWKAMEEKHKQPAQQQQEPVCDKDPQGCWSVRCQLGKVCKNTSPPAQLKPLTDEELQAIADKCRLYPRDFARAIEAAHGIKEDA